MAELSVRVTPKSSRNEITVSGQTVRIYTTAPPADNAANKAVLELLAKKLSLPKSSLEILRGHTSRDKIVAIPDLTPSEILTRLSNP